MSEARRINEAPALDTRALDDCLERLTARKDAWARLSAAERAPFLRAAIDGVLEVADEWVGRACASKQVALDSGIAGQDWVSGPMTTVRGLRLFVQALEAGGRPRPPKIWRRPDGQLVARVLPASLMDRAIFSGMSAEVWIQPGCPATQGRIYRQKERGEASFGKVALVLGAGNIASIPPLDVISKLVIDDEVVLLKMNPVNEYLLPPFRRAFGALFDAGFVDAVAGPPEVGQYLCQHPLVHTIHLTGSDRTHDAIVWGPPSEQAVRKATREPVVDKPVTSELGCVTPVIVVPGRWSSADLQFQARQVASMVAHNASFNCTAAKVLVVASGWIQRQAFFECLRAALSRMEPRVAYYPGAQERYARFMARYPSAEVVGRTGTGIVPWTIAWDVPPRAGEDALCTEAFCGVLSVVTLEGATPDAFLPRAVTFANTDIWGNLSCVLLVDPRTARQHGGALDQAIADLQYGGIAVNAWTGANFSLGCTTWGAFPGNAPENIKSGRGTVHNTFLFDHPQKSVVRAPFRIHPTPIWFTDHRSLATLGRRLTWFEAHPSWFELPAIGFGALRA
jgi:acyl-CoA reductase-like NAD-dependent aldehyde dehydrogenase